MSLHVGLYILFDWSNVFSYGLYLANVLCVSGQEYISAHWFVNSVLYAI